MLGPRESRLAPVSSQILLGARDTVRLELLAIWTITVQCRKHHRDLFKSLVHRRMTGVGMLY